MNDKQVRGEALGVFSLAVAILGLWGGLSIILGFGVITTLSGVRMGAGAFKLAAGVFAILEVIALLGSLMASDSRSGKFGVLLSLALLVGGGVVAGLVMTDAWDPGATWSALKTATEPDADETEPPETDEPAPQPDPTPPRSPDTDGGTGDESPASNNSEESGGGGDASPPGDLFPGA